MCALVCKDWLSRSRSLLALKATITDTSITSSTSELFIELLKHPNMTLTHSIESLVSRNLESLAVLAADLPSVKELKISATDETVAEFISRPFSMPNVRDLSLWYQVFKSAEDFLKVITCFPSIYSLDVYRLKPLYDWTWKAGGFNASAVLVWQSLSELTIDVEREWDVFLLDSILMVSPGIQNLWLRILFTNPNEVAAWVSKTSLTTRSEIKLSLEIFPVNPDPGESGL